MAQPRSSSNSMKSRPSRNTQYERGMSAATQPSSPGLTRTETTQEQQGGRGDSATSASNTAGLQHVPYKEASPQTQRPGSDKHSAYWFERMEHDLLGVGSHTFGSGNIQIGPHAQYSDLLGCPYHRRINQESLVSLSSSQGLSPMARFRAEGLLERNAILPRPDILDKPMDKRYQYNNMMQGRNGVSEDNRGA